MIAGLSKFITLYLSPALSLTALLLSLFAYLSPTVMLHDRVALLTVSPSLSLTQDSTQHIDGPTVFLGALGSCSRPNDGSEVTCTVPTLSPVYDLSVLPDNAPDLLSAPTATTPAFIAVSLGFSILFFLLFSMTSFRHKLGPKMETALDRPTIQRLVAWVGLFGFMIGLTSFLVIRMWFGKAVEDFNKTITKAGGSAPALVANTSNGFIMVYVAYAFYAVPLVCALAKLHVTSGGK
ncbi:hypothetical protein GLOTRDRAFT_68732 [Gloeophyllum trabeum ATCC 11539]|uniref:Uncharacterized protein n=1 Tax=Gloeophyllum trabeum (strain ATCC 11539 / FP-39264 / Madison 617) TaxID=670483 RepID=S7QMT1_GLOTA|nr:uncharacterized protein GLOTRDRAFT_68732 [Gloeophyllum trabeum ATCC 11539]EPQ60788.1 hypothetical protein GLOTRDRAFT_68732 [Gloeophyllum trabeum ATCC 11539]